MIPKTPDEMPSLDAPAEAKPKVLPTDRPGDNLVDGEGGAIDLPSTPKDMNLDD